MNNTSPLRRRLLKLVFCIGWSMCAAELWLRVLSPVPMLPRYVQGSAYGIRVNVPNKVYWHRSVEYAVQMRTNSRGVRSDTEYDMPKPAGVFRIVVLGDSFGMGYESSLEDSSLELLRQGLLSHTDRRVEVVNLSVSGHGTAEELIMFRNEGVEYTPDCVLLYYSSTDPAENTRSELFKLGPDGTLTRGEAVYLPGIEVQQMLLRIPGYNWVADNSNLYNLVRDRAGVEIKKLLLWLAKSRTGGSGIRESSEGSTRDEGRSGSDNEKVIGSGAERLTIALLLEIDREVQKAGAKLVVLSIPSRRSRTEYVDIFPYHVEGADGLDVISPVEEFRQAADPSLKLYWEKGHGHWTPRGQKIVGEILIREILLRARFD